MDEPTYVIASRLARHAALTGRLMARTGRRFVHVATMAELDATLAEGSAIRYVFFLHWSSLIPQTIWGRHECVIFHMTDLPYGRGGSPLQNLITRKHTDTVISALRCVAELDAGPVYLKRPLSLSGSADAILLRATGVMEEMIVELVEATPSPVPQEGPVTVFHRRRPEQSEMRPGMTVDDVYDHIRMLDAEEYPVAFLDVGGLRIEFRGAGRRPGLIEAEVTIRERHAREQE